MARAVQIPHSLISVECGEETSQRGNVLPILPDGLMGGERS